MKEVTIWFDRSLNLHKDEAKICENSFALSKFKENDDNVVFKAAAVIDGNTMLLKFSQVTWSGAKLVGKPWSASATARKYFFKAHLRTMEAKIKEHVKGKKYTKTINLRFRVGLTTKKIYTDLGYAQMGGSETPNRYGPTYVIVNKAI